MKTLEEATELFMIKVKAVGGPLDLNKVREANETIKSNLSRYKEIIEEAQLSPLIHAMAAGIIDQGVDMELSPLQIVILAISHAIPIGIEMERSE